MLKKSLLSLYKGLETHEHRLLYLFLEITRRCNLSCLHCGSDCTSVADVEMTTETWLSVVRYVHSRFGKEPVFVITGGEPLVHEGLTQIGSLITSLGMRWGMVTNGQLLSEDRLKALIDAGIYSITVSLDGGKAGHEKLRNRIGSYDKVISALRFIGKSSIPMRDIVSCVYPGNLHELDEAAQAAHDAGIERMRLFRIFPLGRAKNNPELLLSHADTMQMLNWIKTNRTRWQKKGLAINYSCEGYMNLKLDKAVRDFPFFCRAGINIASILADGSITGCSNNRERFYEGNIARDDFATVWEKGFAKFRDRDWAKTGKCAGCKEFNTCGGSSIHLWDNDSTECEFCYLPNMQ